MNTVAMLFGAGMLGLAAYIAVDLIRALNSSLKNKPLK